MKVQIIIEGAGAVIGAIGINKQGIGIAIAPTVNAQVTGPACAAAA